MEAHLEAQLREVRRQREEVQRRDQLCAGFRPMTPVPCDDDVSRLQSVLDPTFLAAMDCPAALAALLKEEVEGVHSFPLLRPQFCEHLLAEHDRFVQFRAGVQPECGATPVFTDLAGLGWLNDLLLARVVRPLAGALFAPEAVGDLDWRHGWIAGYSNVPAPEKNVWKTGLDLHTDDSEVTLLVHLTAGFAGGELVFHGMRGAADEDAAVGRYNPQVGRAVIHPGRRLHKVQHVTAGQRYTLVLWTRSWQSVRSSTCPCCWMNRRDAVADACVCGPVWN